VSSICDMKQDGDQQEARNVLGKDALVRRIARALAISRKDARVILELILDSMVRALRSGGKVEIRRFGSFRTRQRSPRSGRNPRTGARVKVPAKRVPYFTPSQGLREALSNLATCN